MSSEDLQSLRRRSPPCFTAFWGPCLSLSDACADKWKHAVVTVTLLKSPNTANLITTCRRCTFNFVCKLSFASTNSFTLIDGITLACACMRSTFQHVHKTWKTFDSTIEITLNLHIPVGKKTLMRFYLQSIQGTWLPSGATEGSASSCRTLGQGHKGGSHPFQTPMIYLFIYLCIFTASSSECDESPPLLNSNQQKSK